MKNLLCARHGTIERGKKQKGLALLSSQSHGRRERTQILITNSKYRRHRQTDYRKAAGRGGEFRFCGEETSSEPKPRSSGAPHRAELKDGYSKEKEEQVQSPDMGRIGRTGW